MSPATSPKSKYQILPIVKLDCLSLKVFSFLYSLVGQSRSATIVLGYLMHKLDMSLDDALTILMKQRPSIRYNVVLFSFVNNLFWY